MNLSKIHAVASCIETQPLLSLSARAHRPRLGRRIAGRGAPIYHVKDRGLVVITSCGHAGVINSVRHAQKVSGIQKVHAIVGGFHLAPAPDDIVAKTVAVFKDINPDYIIPMHCSGVNMIMAVHMAMPKTLVMPSTGTRVVFGV